MGVTNYELTQAQNSAASNLNSNITHIAVGDDNTPYSVGDTSLGNQTFIQTIDTQKVSSNVVTADVRLDATENNGNDIDEIGLLDAASSGNLYTRNITTNFAKTSSNEAFYRVKVTYTAEDDS